MEPSLLLLWPRGELCLTLDHACTWISWQVWALALAFLPSLPTVLLTAPNHVMRVMGDCKFPRICQTSCTRAGAEDLLWLS